MKEALVVHPRFTIYGGGETVCLHVVEALQKAGYHVILVTDSSDTATISRNLGARWKQVLDQCDFLDTPTVLRARWDTESKDLLPFMRFRGVIPRFMALQRLFYSRKVRERIESQVHQVRPSLVFNTQSSLFLTKNPRGRTFNVFYDPSDLLVMDPKTVSPLISSYKVPYYWIMRHFIYNPAKVVRDSMSIPLSKQLEEKLEELKTRHSEYLYPPAELCFRPKLKKKQVVQATRIVPHKRLELFMRIAKDLPEYRFILAGAENPGYEGYLKKLLGSKPDNVEYIECRIRDRPELIEESTVYLYTSVEPGINITTCQAVGAGCIPITPWWGGGAEIVQALGIGGRWKFPYVAVDMIREAMNGPVPDPWVIAEKSKIFSGDHFESRIIQLVSRA